MEDLYYVYNPWWEGKDFDSGIPRQEYLTELEKPFQRKQIDIIIGSRRVGKTTFLKQLIKNCLDKNIFPQKIVYLALDNFQSPQAIEVKYDSQFDWQDKRFTVVSFTLISAIGRRHPRCE